MSGKGLTQAIIDKRAEAQKNAKPRKEGVNYKLVCPSCTKPNSVTVPFCTGCGFELSEWDAQEVSGTYPFCGSATDPDTENIFWDLVQGKDIGCTVLHRDTDFIVFDDKFPVSGIEGKSEGRVKGVKEKRLGALFFTETRFPLATSSLFQVLEGKVKGE